LIGGKLCYCASILRESVLNCHAVCQTLRENPPHLFAEIGRKRDEMVTKGVDIINMGG